MWYTFSFATKFATKKLVIYKKFDTKKQQLSTCHRKPTSCSKNISYLSLYAKLIPNGLPKPRPGGAWLFRPSAFCPLAFRSLTCFYPNVTGANQAEGGVTIL